MVTAVLRFIEFNTRVPARVLADVHAQMAAIELAARELGNLIQPWEVSEFCAYVDDLIDYSERLTRAQIRTLPDGVTEFTDWNDDDGIGGERFGFAIEHPRRFERDHPVFSLAARCYQNAESKGEKEALNECGAPDGPE